MRDKIFYAICFGILLGVLLRSFVFVSPQIFLFVGLLASAVLLFLLCSVRIPWAIVLAVLCLGFACGALLLHLKDKNAPQNIEIRVGQSTTLQGVLIDEPDRRVDNQKLSLKIKDQNGVVGVLVTTSLENEYFYGDELKFTGKLAKPENFETDTGKTFDYVNYLRKDGILYVVYYPKIELISSDNGFFIKRILFAIKNKFLEKINFAIPEPESILMGGLILGERSTFDAEMRQKLIDTGTIHIVALSGYNITIVSEWFMRIFSFFPANVAIASGIGAIFLFVLMSGASSTGVRAGIMAVLVLVARATGRTYDVGRALIVAMLVMIIVNPFILRYDVSFQLSVIATVAVIFLAPKWEKFFTWIPKKLGLRNVVSATFAAYIFVLPFILYQMGNLSLVALPANILILPFIPMTMVLGFVTGFLGIIFYPLSIPSGALADLLLSYELFVVDLFSGFSFASFSIPDFPFIITIVIYTWFIYYLFWNNIKKFFSEF